MNVCFVRLSDYDNVRMFVKRVKRVQAITKKKIPIREHFEIDCKYRLVLIRRVLLFGKVTLSTLFAKKLLIKKFLIIWQIRTPANLTKS